VCRHSRSNRQACAPCRRPSFAQTRVLAMQKVRPWWNHPGGPAEAKGPFRGIQVGWGMQHHAVMIKGCLLGVPFVTSFYCWLQERILRRLAIPIVKGCQGHSSPVLVPRLTKGSTAFLVGCRAPWWLP
jgi:hypothetical protein